MSNDLVPENTKENVFKGVILCDGIMQGRLEEVVESDTPEQSTEEMVAYKTRMRAEIASRGHIVSDAAWDDIFSTIKTDTIYRTLSIQMGDIERLGAYIALDVLGARAETLGNIKPADEQRGHGFVDGSNEALDSVRLQFSVYLDAIRKGLGIETENPLQALLERPVELAAA